MIRFLKKLFFVLIAICTSSAVILSTCFWYIGESNVASHSGLIEVQKGYTINKIATRMEEKSIIEDKSLFEIYMKIFLRITMQKYHFGEFKINKGESYHSIAKKLVSSDVYLRKITIPEGTTVFQIKKILSDAVGLVGEIPEDIEEGSMLPETYLYEYGTTYESLIKRMQNAMSDLIDKKIIGNKNTAIKSKRDLIIAASLIEKEYHDDEDVRRKISGVIENRINKRMRLQFDTTVIYALSDGRGSLGRELTLKDLKQENPYSTYKNYGLPIGAICCPSKSAIMAALNPIKHDYLFFIDTVDGAIFETKFDSHVVNKFRDKAASKGASFSDRDAQKIKEAVNSSTKKQKQSK